MITEIQSVKGFRNHLSSSHHSIKLVWNHLSIAIIVPSDKDVTDDLADIFLQFFFLWKYPFNNDNSFAHTLE